MNRSSEIPARGRIAAGAAVAAALACGGAMAAVVTVTPTSPQGWVLTNGFAAQPPAQITGAQPFDGNGSIQFDISAPGQQPLAVYSFGSNSIRFGDLLTSGASFGYSYMLPVGTQPAGSPTIRLLLSGLSNSGQVGRSDGSLGWYLNGAADGLWHTDLFTMASGDFFFRIGGRGQVSAAGCSPGAVAQSFDDRRQTLGEWATECAGAATGTVDLDDALVTGIEVDWGSFAAVGPVSAYADRINFNLGNNVGDFNFEVTAADVPEPGSLALAAGALLSLAALRRRVRQR